LKRIFVELKKILSRPDDDVVFDKATKKVSAARQAAEAGKYFSTIF